MKGLFIITLMFIGSVAYSQQNSYASLAYEGGYFNRPGFSAGYLFEKELGNRLSLRPGIKVGMYFHRRYHNALFVLPKIQLIRSGKKKGFMGIELNAGYQKHFIPKVHQVLADGNVRETNGSTNHFVLAPGLLFGRKFNLFSKQFEWFLNPQLQFRRNGAASDGFESDKYFIMAAGINYKLNIKKD